MDALLSLRSTRLVRKEELVFVCLCADDTHVHLGLQYLWGAAFEAKYKQYEADGLGRKRIKARALWFRILESQVETGTPYLLYKDAANAKSNQQHCGTIQSSNLCTEILEYTSIDEVAVCNLASISLPAFVEEGTAGGARTFNFKRLEHITAQVTRALNLVIDHNYYPLEEARRSNMRHRPIGIGVQVSVCVCVWRRWLCDTCC